MVQKRCVLYFVSQLAINVEFAQASEQFDVNLPSNISLYPRALQKVIERTNVPSNHFLLLTCRMEYINLVRAFLF